MEASPAADTVNAPIPLMDPDFALTVAAPTAFPVARPELLMLTIPEGELVQLTELVRSCVLPSV
jgi:hypothetical protein